MALEISPMAARSTIILRGRKPAKLLIAAAAPTLQTLQADCAWRYGARWTPLLLSGDRRGESRQRRLVVG